MIRLRVVVVGAGIVGAWLSTSLAERGAVVTLVEAGTPGGGTTQASFAWINASTKDDTEYFNLNVSGLLAWQEADRVQPGIGGYLRCGAYEWAADARGAQQIADRATRLQGQGYHAREVGAAHIAALQPGIDVSDLVGAAGSYPDEAVVDPDRAVGEAIRRLRDAGGRVREETPVDAVLTAGGRAVGVQTIDGDRLSADAVVLAAGTGNEALCRPLGVEAGLEAVDAAVVRGATLRATVTGGPAIAAVFRTPGINLRPAGRGGVLLHSDRADEAATDESSGAAAAGDLARRAQKRLGKPVTAGQFRTANRVMPRDGRSIAGWADGVAGLYLLSTHSGVTLALALAETAGSEVTGGVESPQLAPYRPQRFNLGPAGA